MGKDTMDMVSLAAATPAYVETFRYLDGGMEKNVQDEFERRSDHLMVSRVVNWETFDELVVGWTPSNSLLATAEEVIIDTKYELYIDEGIAYIGGRRYVRSTKDYIDDGTSDPGSGETTYNIYLKYTNSSDDFTFDITTSTRVDSSTIKYLILATAAWAALDGWSGVVDKRASNTSLGAPATVSGSDAGAIFTVENTGAGDGLLVKSSDAVIGESGTPQQLIVQGDGTKAISIYNSSNSVEMVCSAADTMKVQSVADGDAELIVKTLNGMVVASGVVTTGTWQGTAVSAAYIGSHNHTSSSQGGDYAWADITGFDGGGSATTVSRSDHIHDTRYYTETEQAKWMKRSQPIARYGGTGITEDYLETYPVLKMPSLSTDYFYFVFNVSDEWTGNTNFVCLLCADSNWSDQSEFYIDVKAFKEYEAPPATWNITSGLVGSLTVSTTTTYVGDSFSGIEGGDVVVARIGGFDGTNNDAITYAIDAYLY